MLKPILVSSFCMLVAIGSTAQVAVHGHDQYSVTFVKDRRALPDESRQSALRSQPSWRHFVAEHPQWRVEFNEQNWKPHRAFGPGIPTVGGTPEERAWSFLAGQAQSFHIAQNELYVRSVSSSSKHHFVHFGQRHNGMEVLWGHALVKMDLQGRVISFGLDVYDLITPLPEPVQTDEALRSAAAAGVEAPTSFSIDPALAILPIPATDGVDLRIVKQVRVEARGSGVPSDLLCLVDAVTGQLLYRSDRIVTEKGHDGAEVGADVTFSATVSNTIPTPSSILPLRNLNLVAGGQSFVTDPNGNANTGLAGPIPFSTELSGTWGTVFTNGNTPALSGTLQEGANAVTFDNNATEEETSAYYHVNNIHDHAVDVLPGFTGMDIDLPINVDRTDGDCNAFYDGSSINFYLEANDCYSLALINDVVYHEYGHGINATYYASQSASFTNGGMNEGYADVWAFSLSLNPVLAEGYKISTPAAFIRVYNAAPKVYPVDIVGEVHADGEIIAGAWWDTYVNLGNNMVQTMDLFADAFPGLQATVANGNEGSAFRAVLIDVLEADDDDGNLINGTPNGSAIAEAFRKHGITLISGFDVAHTPVETSLQDAGILIEATAVVSGDFDVYVQGVQLNYRANTGAWQQVLMTAVGGDNYEATIPGQPTGTVISYYIGLLDINGVLSGVTPSGADQEEPNLPNYILVGYDLQLTEDVDNLNELGNWDLGLSSDNNTTGTWELFAPEASFSTVDGSEIQTGQQHTVGGEYCFFTENGNNPDTPGEADVDGGHTTLQGYPMDLSGYENPTFTLYRWYTNSPPGGANPGQDWWYVQITNNGTDWVFVENTRTDDRSWRKLAFRVQDYVTPTSTVQLRFIASDSTHVGQNLDGGSLIEAAVDDIQLWDNTSVGIGEMRTDAITALYPDPANDQVDLVLAIPAGSSTRIDVIDPAGRIVLSDRLTSVAGITRSTVDVSELSAGGYVMRAQWEGGSAQKQFSIVR
ncbi:MAG: T9SS type A sorting domain-containing protein [Flavobacteriales bacterium]|nr:T9SS type A sorting domain-containing protein [Flavobacteriales bacterium]